MSTITADAESFVTFNQAGPQSSQAKIIEGQHLPIGLNNVPKHIMTFYRGQPEALGATQIFVGIFSIMNGVFLTMNCTYSHRSCFHIAIFSGVFFWSGLAYVISGSLSVAAAANPTVGKVKSSLVTNTISSVLGGISILLYAINFASTFSYYATVCAYYEGQSECEGSFDLYDFYKGMQALQLLFVLLMFTITVSTAVFGCKSVCRSSFQEVTVVIYQTAPATTDTTDTKAF